jgi:hypothetical protein
LTLVSRAEFLRRSAALAGLALVPELAGIACPIVW